MKQRKHIEMDDRQKRQFTSLSLLLAAAFFAVIGQVGWWLAIAIAAGVVIDEIIYLFAKRKAKPEEKDPGAEKKEELPEETDRAAGTEEPKQPDDRDVQGPKE